MNDHEHYFRAGEPDPVIDGHTYRYFRCGCGQNYSTEISADGDIPAPDVLQQRPLE